MFKFLTLLALATAAVSVSGAAVLQERAILRSDWQEAGRAAAEDMHEVLVAVQQLNLDVADRMLQAVSNPRSEKYGQHLNFQQVGKLVRNVEGTEAVLRWLRQEGCVVVHTTTHGEYIKARAPVSTFERMFSTEFFNFRNGDKTAVRAKQYSLPEEMDSFVHAVFGTVQMPPRVRPGPQVELAATRGDGSITPAVLNDYYNIYTNTGNEYATQSLFEAVGQTYSPSDLSQFQSDFDLPQDEVDDVIGGHEDDDTCKRNANNCAEANLDVQYMMAVSQISPTTYWYESGLLDPFTAWIQDVADTEDPPLVHSMSYGEDEQDVPSSSATTFNTEAMKLGLRGVTIAVASGDDGADSPSARNSPRNCGYAPSWPATSQYVVAVGATQGAENGDTETVCQSDTGGVITSGGGFSILYDQPTYQNSAVASYFAGLSRSEEPVSGYGSGRAIPDVSLAGYNYEVVIGGKTYGVSGTSASTPAFAGFISLANAKRLAAGKSALGYINQALWENAASYANDVTEGNNLCTASDTCCDEGFYASTGWDPTTGWGSVDFTKFMNVFENL